MIIQTAGVLLQVAVPALISEVGQGFRQYLEHRRQRQQRPLEERVTALEARVAKLEPT